MTWRSQLRCFWIVPMGKAGGFLPEAIIHRPRADSIEAEPFDYLRYLSTDRKYISVGFHQWKHRNSWMVYSGDLIFQRMA